MFYVFCLFTPLYRRFRLSRVSQTKEHEEIYRLISKILNFTPCGSVFGRICVLCCKKGHMSFKQRTLMGHELKMERTAAKREVISWTMRGGGGRPVYGIHPYGVRASVCVPVASWKHNQVLVVELLCAKLASSPVYPSPWHHTRLMMRKEGQQKNTHG